MLAMHAFSCSTWPVGTKGKCEVDQLHAGAQFSTLDVQLSKHLMFDRRLRRLSAAELPSKFRDQANLHPIRTIDVVAVDGQDWPFTIRNIRQTQTTSFDVAL